MEKTAPQQGPKCDHSEAEIFETRLVSKDEQWGDKKQTIVSTDSETEEETDTEFPDADESIGRYNIDSVEGETDTEFAEAVVYKDKHKIGSRKASEGVITYNEPMYQSLMSSMLDNVKRTSPVKNKNSDSSRSKSLNSSPVKRTQIDFERSLSFESAVKVKKKLDSVEHAINENRSKAAFIKEKKQPLEKANKPNKTVKKTKVIKQTLKSEQKELDSERKKNEQKTVKSDSKKKVQKNETKDMKLPKNTNIKPKKTPHKDSNMKKKVNSFKTKGDDEDGKNAKKINSAKTQNNENKGTKEKVSKTKPVVPLRRLKREASLNAVTFMNLLYVKEESSPPKHIEYVAKRSKSETDIQTVVKKQKRHSTPESLAAFEETIDEVIQKIRAENTINEVVERIKAEVNDNERTINDKSYKEIERQNSDESGFNDDVFQKDKFDFIKIKTSAAKNKKQTNIKTVKTPITKTIKGMEKHSPEEIAEKKRKANLARLKKAREILKQGKIRSMKMGTDSDERKLLNMKLSKLSLILKRKQKQQENGEQDKSSQNVLNNRKGKAIDQTKPKVKRKEKDHTNKPRRPKKIESETFRSARTHMESPKRVIRPSSCQCCQSYYQNQGTSFWSNRNVVNRGSYNQEPCIRPSYSQETFPSNVVNRQTYNPEPCPGPSSELPASSTVDIHPYSSPSHVPMVDNNPYVGQLVPTHYPQCNSCTCVHGALVSAPCPQCAIGGVPLLTCHHQGFSNTYPVTFPHSHGTYSHTCGCTYCASGSFHPSSSPMIHQTIRAEAPYLVHHSVPLQLPHESSHPLPVQLSHSERPLPPITHQVSQVSHGDLNSLHLTHVYSVPHSELSSATTVNPLVPTDQEFIDVGQDDLSENMNIDNQRNNSSTDNVTEGGAKGQTPSSQSSNNKENSFSSNKSSNKKALKLKDSETKYLKPKPKRLNSAEEKDKTKSENKAENTKLKRKRSDDDTKIDKKDMPKGVKKPKIEAETKDDVLLIKQKVITKIKNTAKQKDTVKKNEIIKQKDAAKRKDTVKENEIIKQKEIVKLKDTVKQRDTAKQTDTSKQTDTAKQKHSAQLKDITKQKDTVKKTKTKEVKKGVHVKEIKKKERKNSGGNKEKVQKSVSSHGWVWEGEPEVRTLTGIFDGKQVIRKCYKAIKHDDGDIIQIKDCILVCSGARYRDMPYVAKVTNFWEEPNSGEMMMTLLWYYRPEHTEGGRQPYHKDCEVFAAKHRDESPVACIDDRCYVLTYNEYCRFMAEVARTKYDLPPRDKVVPDPEEAYPYRRIPPVDQDPENVLLCRHVYDFKLKRVLKNPS